MIKYGLNKNGLSIDAYDSWEKRRVNGEPDLDKAGADAFTLVASTCTHGIQGRPQAIH